MKKIIYFMYAIVCYGIFFATFLYLIGFVENISNFSFATSFDRLFPKTLDYGTATFSGLPAMLIDLLLIALFGIQHSVMARPGFKEKWTKLVPRPIERSTYVLFASLALILLFYFWQPIKITLWDFSQSYTGDIFLGLSMLGWVLLLITTFLINHFDLFGLRQVYTYARNERDKIEHISFRTPLFYRIVRHPLYFSFLMAFWFAPVMTIGHLVFTMGMTLYIFIGIYYEEKDLLRTFGDTYKAYKEQTAMIIPIKLKKPKEIFQMESNEL